MRRVLPWSPRAPRPSRHLLTLWVGTVSDISGRGKAAKTPLDFPILSPEPTLSCPHRDRPPCSFTSSLKPGLGPTGHAYAALQDVRTCRCPESCQGTEFPSGAWLALSDAPQPTPRAVRAHGAAVLCGHGCAQGAVVALRTGVQAEVLDGPSTGVAVITWPGVRNARRCPLPEKFSPSSCPVTRALGPEPWALPSWSSQSPPRPFARTLRSLLPLTCRALPAGGLETGLLAVEASWAGLAHGRHGLRWEAGEGARRTQGGPV